MPRLRGPFAIAPQCEGYEVEVDLDVVLASCRSIYGEFFVYKHLRKFLSREVGGSPKEGLVDLQASKNCVRTVWHQPEIKLWCKDTYP